jgi:four helix bundle protein
MQRPEKIRSVKDLMVYNRAFDLFLQIFKLTKPFPKEEIYSLTDQIRRSSRSVCINIREGYAKRKYDKYFVFHLITSLGSSEETRGWLGFSEARGYISKPVHAELDRSYGELSAMINSLSEKWRNFITFPISLTLKIQFLFSIFYFLKLSSHT